ncbi:MAG: phage tail protein [Cytophagales bacterium]|nr:phage tail protein [Cytophagales bacterium]
MDNLIPTGTIVPFAGEFTEKSIKLIHSMGWLPCDGTAYPKKKYALLALTIGSAYGEPSGGPNGSFNVPDLRGRFMRAVSGKDGADPDASIRKASNLGGNDRNKIGSLQSFATGKPLVAFKSNQAGAHTHQVPNAPVNNNAYAVAGSHYGLWNSGSRSTNSSGDHHHSINSGYNAESRPINTYVNFIIKYSE